MQPKKSGYWTKEHCASEAKKYSTRSHFQRMASGAWNAANKNGWLDEICSHMEVRWQRKWDTKAKCSKEAKKYKNRTDFQKNSPGAWNAAINMIGWMRFALIWKLMEICSKDVFMLLSFLTCPFILD